MRCDQFTTLKDHTTIINVVCKSAHHGSIQETKMRIAEPKKTSRDGLATVEQASLFLSMSRATIYTLMDRGTLPSLKLGKSRRIPWNALRELATPATGMGA